MYGIWNRLQYMLSPQFDIYEQVSRIVSGNVLDVGCGTGFGTHLLTRNADYVLGVDVDEIAIEFATRAFSNHKIKFHCLDIASSFAHEANPYDFIIMIDVIEHIAKDNEAISNCVKYLLKHNGTLICSTPNRMSRYRKSDHHVKEYYPKELESLLLHNCPYVEIVDYKLKPTQSEYENPIIAICR